MQRVDGNRVYFSSARETPESCCRSELSRRFWLFEATALFIYLTVLFTGAARCGFGQKGCRAKSLSSGSSESIVISAS